MREICMPFNVSMAGAIWEGRKTVTRRPIKPQPCDIGENGPFVQISMEVAPGIAYNRKKYIHCPYGQPGDILCVRDPARVIEVRGGSREITIQYLADNSTRTVKYPDHLAPVKVGNCLSNGTYKEACRSRCKILSVRIERIQDITHSDAVAEGIFCEEYHWRQEEYPLGDMAYKSSSSAKFRYSDAKDAYQELWESIYPLSWERNVWVWRIAFEKVEDAI